jgi:hypothetical protein
MVLLGLKDQRGTIDFEWLLQVAVSLRIQGIWSIRYLVYVALPASEAGVSKETEAYEFMLVACTN